MKKFEFILKFILYYVLGYIIFIAIISLLETTLLIRLSDGIVDFMAIFLKESKECIITYSIVFLLILLFNILYNFVSVKRLNSKLDKMKKE